MILYLVRHTKVNIQPGFCYGQSDIGLADTFDKEKEVILEKFKAVEFGYVYSSPLLRCQALAEAIAYTKCIVVHDDRLKELNFGRWEGQLWDDISLTAEAKNWFADYANIPCPEGESYRQLLARVQKFLLELKAGPPEKNSVIVCHAVTIRAFYCLIQNIDPAETFLISSDYGQVHELELIR